MKINLKKDWWIGGVMLAIVVMAAMMMPRTKSKSVNEPGFLTQAREIFVGARDEFMAQVDNRDDLLIWWRTDEGAFIVNDESMGVIMETSCENDSADMTVYKKLISTVAPKVEEVMISQGFAKSIVNTPESVTNSGIDLYVQGYEKEGIKAVLELGPCSSGSDGKMVYTMMLGYTDSYQENFEQQAPFIRDLGLKDEAVRESVRLGDFARLDVNSRASGYFIIAKHDGSKWETVYSGQDSPQCSIMEKAGVPEEIYISCYDQDSL